MVDRVPAEEWAEIFDEVWRRYRDFFYVRNMHGYDWEAIGERYRRWLPHVGHRVGPQLRARRDGRRAERRARLHRRGRLPAAGAPEGRAPRGTLRARPGGGTLPHRPHLPREERGAALPLAAHRGRRRRTGRRLRAGHRRRRAPRRGGSLPAAAPQDRSGDAHGQREADGRTGRARSRTARSPTRATCSTSVGWPRPAQRSSARPADASATSTSPTWERPGSTSSSSGSIRRSARKG